MTRDEMEGYVENKSIQVQNKQLFKVLGSSVQSWVPLLKEYMERKIQSSPTQENKTGKSSCITSEMQKWLSKEH